MNRTSYLEVAASHDSRNYSVSRTKSWPCRSTMKGERWLCPLWVCPLWVERVDQRGQIGQHLFAESLRILVVLTRLVEEFAVCSPFPDVITLVCPIRQTLGSIQIRNCRICHIVTVNSPIPAWRFGCSAKSAENPCRCGDSFCCTRPQMHRRVDRIGRNWDSANSK